MAGSRSKLLRERKKVVESMGLELLDQEQRGSNHYYLRVKNPETGEVREFTASSSPKCAKHAVNALRADLRRWLSGVY